MGQQGGSLRRGNRGEEVDLVAPTSPQIPNHQDDKEESENNSKHSPPPKGSSLEERIKEDMEDEEGEAKHTAMVEYMKTKDNIDLSTEMYKGKIRPARWGDIKDWNTEYSGVPIDVKLEGFGMGQTIAYDDKKEEVAVAFFNKDIIIGSDIIEYAVSPLVPNPRWNMPFIIHDNALNAVDVVIKGIVHEPKCLSLAVFLNTKALDEVEGWEMQLISWETALIKQGNDDKLGHALRSYFTTHRAEISKAMGISCGEKSKSYMFTKKNNVTESMTPSGTLDASKKSIVENTQSQSETVEKFVQPAEVKEFAATSPQPTTTSAEVVPEQSKPKAVDKRFEPQGSGGLIGQNVITAFSVKSQHIGTRHCLDFDSNSISSIGQPFQ